MFSIKVNSTNQYHWDALECDVCKTAYPLSFIHNQIRYSLTEVLIPSEPHIILESLSKEKDNSRDICVLKVLKNNGVFVDEIG